MNTITNICRFLVGVLFIISGLIKANDALGFSYKLDEYFVVFHMEFLSFASLFLAMFICVFEVGLGVALLFGVRMKLVAWSLLLMIVFFTFLTFYSAYFNKVTDCGCFGDAVKLTPWQSFSKDVVLLVLILVIFFRRNQISVLFNESFATFLTVAGFAATTWFTIHCYNHLPVIDFRPYAIGKNIKEGMTLPEGAKKEIREMVFLYKKDGKQIEIKSEDISKIDDSYTFVDRIDKVIQKGDEPKIHDFKIVDAEGSDYTEEVLNNKDYNFILVAYDISKTNHKVQAQINQFQRNCEKNKINFIGITGSAPAETDIFRHDVEAMYDYYFCDATALKTMIRSNPGLILLKGGTVIDMWHYNDFPEYKEFEEKYQKN